MFGPRVTRLMEQRQIARGKLGQHLMADWDAVHAKEFEMAIALDSGDQATVDRLIFEEKREMVADALSENF